MTVPVDGWSEDIPKGREPGVYYVWYKVIGDENHNGTEPVCITVTIIPDSQVEQFIEAVEVLPLPENLTLEDKATVDALRELYDSLSEQQKGLIPDEVKWKFTDAEARIRELEEQVAAADMAVAERFTAAVNAVPGNKAGEGKGLVDKATEIRKKMTGAQMVLVTEETFALYNEELAAFENGRVFRSGDAYYRVMSGGDVTYLKPASKEIEGVLVPNQVKKGKFFLKVIRVSNNAFQGCSNLKWAVISKNVYVFGEYAFARTGSLTKVRILGKGFKPGKVTDAFLMAGKNGRLTLKVPGSKVDEYRELFTGEGRLNGTVKAA